MFAQILTKLEMGEWRNWQTRWTQKPTDSQIIKSPGVPDSLQVLINLNYYFNPPINDKNKEKLICAD